MQGRHGQDELNRALSWFAVAMLVVSMFTNWMVFYYLALAAFVYYIFRMLSRNGSKRGQENMAYKNMRAPIVNAVKLQIRRFKERKEYRYFRCPRCKQWLRVPRGKGKVSIKCRVCDMRFEKKT